MRVFRVNGPSAFSPVAIPPEPVQVWAEVDGKRRPTGQQATIDGVPLWRTTMLAQVMEYGRPVPELVQLEFVAGSIEDAVKTAEVLTA
ncbi:hypothetical protein [uncultured Tessaracoccus sp.]|uniref:hypothetical protein n=1 Tax=uncultured Tessaracoccus sp. TaxID=905023 RepID=UPI00260EC5A4|nr:hypothetical protein [uncultured Tessaracoccus sp.]